MRRERPFAILFAAAVGIAMLVGLGVWQLQRLGVKEAEIEALRRAASDAAPALSLADAEARMLADPARDRVRAEVRGRFRTGVERYLFAVSKEGPGWHVLAPLDAAEGRIVVVDRGYVPDALRGALAPPAGEVSVVGLLRRQRPKGVFTPENDEARNAWYWPDLPALLRSMGAPPERRPLGFLLEALPAQGDPPWPRAERPDPASLPNNHLQYAITWFSLAAVLAGMTAALLRTRRNG